MPVLYLTEQGSVLRKDGLLLAVVKDGATLQKVPATKVEQVVVFGNVQLTTPVVTHLLREGIDCVFCSSNGNFHGRLISTESAFGQLRQAQLRTASDQAAILAMAREIVRGKLRNQRTLLLRYQRARPRASLALAVEGIDTCLRRLDGCRDLASIQAMEGQGSAHYYRALRTLLRHDLGFSGRKRRPPRDPVNSMLSFGYTLLVYAMQAAVRTVGLDPFIGFLHSTQYSRPSLVLDLIEEFRAIVVDSVVLRAVNTGVMTAADFRQEPDGAVLLTQDGMKSFVDQFERRVQSLVRHPRERKQVTYRRCFELQARHLARVVLRREETYQPFLVR